MASLASNAIDDYFDDFTAEEEALLCEIDNQLLASSAAASTGPSAIVPTGNLPSILAPDAESAGSASDKGSSTPTVSVAHTRSSHASSSAHVRGAAGDGVQVSGEFSTGVSSAELRGMPPVAASQAVVYPDLSRAFKNIPPPEPTPAEPSLNDSDSSVSFEDEPSPLQRFRTYPKKPFSVTDFTSGGAWCELQYYYTLTRLPGGRKTKTAIMKAGSKVHRALEDEVHVRVHVEATTKEDILGLKLWNVVQGLRTLRETGLTRELEVWGTVDGHLVTGIIDSLSYTCPNEEFEEEVLSSQESARGAPSTRAGKAQKQRMVQRMVYLADVKTRGRPNLPTGAAALRPTKIQLFLYHRFLSEMISGKLDFSRVFRRLSADPDEPFTDEFLAQMASIHDEVLHDASQDTTQSDLDADEDEGNLLLRYRTLRELLALLREELKLTFPRGKDTLGPLLSVDYRYRVDGSILGSNTFPMDDAALDLHIASDMEWWKGERRPRGVDIEDAFKCRICEFAEDCSWRARLEAEQLRKAKEKMQARKESAEVG